MDGNQLDPALFAQRLAGDGGIPPAALQALLHQNQRGSAFNPLQPPGAQYQQVPPATGAINLFSQLLNNPASLAQLQGAQDVVEPKPARSGRARSGGDGRGAGNGMASASYASRHQQAEARRRSRINERLEALRRVVPHSERANTATFLEEVLKYVERLQQRVMELEGRLGLEPTVKVEGAQRGGEGGLLPEPSTVTGGTSENMATQSLVEQQQQQKQQQPTHGGGRGGSERRGGGGGGPDAASLAAAAAAAALADQGVRLAGSGGFPAPSGPSAGAGGDDLPSVSEELAMAAALQAPPRAGSAAATGMMAESRPPPGAPAQQAQQAGRPPVDLYTAARELAVQVGGANGTGGGLPRASGASSPLSSIMLQQAAQALLGPGATPAFLSGQFGQPLPQQQQQHQFRPQQLPGAALGLAQQQHQQGHGFGGPGGGSPMDPLLAGLLGNGRGGGGGALLSPSFPALSGGGGGPPQDPSAQLQYHLMAAQQAAQQVAQQSLSGSHQQHGQPRPQFDLASSLLPPPLGGGSGMPYLNTSGGPAAPAASAPTRPAESGPAAPAAVGAVGKDLSSSGRSQQTQHATAGPAEGAAPASAGAKRGLPPVPSLPGPSNGDKKPRLQARPTASL